MSGCRAWETDAKGIMLVAPGKSGKGGCCERLRAWLRGEEYGELSGELCTSNASRIVRIDRTMFN